MPEPVSIISFAIAQGIKERPNQAAAEMLALIRENARLEMELFLLRGHLRELSEARAER